MATTGDTSEGTMPPSKKLCPEDNQPDKSESFVPREYQIEILESAKERNTIACLGTGTGKTFIAVLLIREMSHFVQIPFSEGGKKIFFLVPTVPLVEQQAGVIERHTELKVGRYVGEMKVDAWSKDVWQEEFQNQEVLVMTAEICNRILHHSFLKVSQLCLIIFDECHQARGKSPYAEIMKVIHTSNSQEIPRLFGLSASLLNGKCKPSRLEKELRSLEVLLRSTIETASDYSEVQKYGTDPDEFIVMYEEATDSPVNHAPVICEIEQCLRQTSEFLEANKMSLPPNRVESICDYNSAVCFFRKPERSVQQLGAILKNFGPWCTYCAAEVYRSDIEKSLLRLDSLKERDVMIGVKTKFSEIIEICKRSGYDNFRNTIDFIPNKLEKFLEVFDAIRELERHDCKTPSSALPTEFNVDPVAYNVYLQEMAANDSSSNICGIVFVEQRIFANVLCKWIVEIGKNKPEFSFLKPSFIVGHGAVGSGMDNKEAAMSVKKQEKIVKSFRDKEFNILIATSVLEEGIDVQKCNIVVRFDLPKDFRAYVQSKGRARSQGSKFVMMLSEREFSTFAEDLCNFRTIEELLLKKTHNRDMPNAEDIKKYGHVDLLPPYMPFGSADSARITLSSAIGILNRYCALLPCDMTTKLTPRWTLKVFDPDATVEEYTCTLQLPINSPLRKVIEGEKMKRKKYAKMAAALKACELLHKIGELNDNLLPFSNAVEIAFEELGVMDEEESSTGGKPGTNNRRQLYKKKVSEFLRQSLPVAGEPCYLHVLVLDLVVPLAKSLNPKGRPLVNPADSILGFGFLASKKLPKVCKFPIFTKVGKIRVEIICYNESLVFSQLELSRLREFHKFIFADTLWLENEKIEFDPDGAECSYYVVPVNKSGSSLLCSLDWDFIGHTLSHEYNREKLKKSVSDVRRKLFENSLFDDAVVTRSYYIDKWCKEKPAFYHVTKIEHDLSPCSPFPGKREEKFKDFKEFYKSVHDIDIISDHQPLLIVERCQSLDMEKPLYVTVGQVFNDNSEGKKSMTKLRRERFREYFIPELCIIHPFPSAMFRKATYIPTVMYRLNQLLLAEELRQSVVAAEFGGTVSLPADFCWPTFNFERSDEELREFLVSRGEIISEEYPDLVKSEDVMKSAVGEIESFEVKSNLSAHFGPNPSVLLQALTTTSAGDEFNLERLEMIGDSFLKYAMSVKCYTKFPVFDEGKLTKLRILLIRNLHLYQVAKEKKIAEHLVHTPFDCKRKWLPPCYKADEDYVVVAESKKKGITNRVVKKGAGENEHIEIDTMYTLQLISDKCVADSVEALIGAFLLSCGYQGALRFMHWLSLSAYLDPTDGQVNPDFDNWPPIPRDPVLADYANHPERPLCEGRFALLKGFEALEARIGYKFKEPAYLLQAFTHTSYFYNEITDCYQRLEFLGDAVLDYLVTRKLFDDPKGHSPGKLTDLRSALVNNIYFASLAVKHGFHKNLKLLSVSLCKLVENFILFLQDSDDYKNFEEFGYYLEEVECFDLAEVEVPKALGDIFESVAGAIYLDSGMSLDAVWKVYYPMMKPAIDHLCEHVPTSPVRQLLEMVHDHRVFSNVEVKGDKTYVLVKLPCGKEIEGVGPNKRVAKRSAAKRAVAYLKREELRKKGNFSPWA